MTIEVVKQLNYKFDFERVKKDVLGILEKYNLPQIGITHSPRSINLYPQEKILDCTGSLYDYDNDKFITDEREFTLFNEEFKSTSLYEMYQSIPNIGRFRIMTMDGPKCYTIHNDLCKRYHYVVDTNYKCLFLFPGLKQMHHIPMDGSLYLVDTRYKHTFVNGSRQRRIHLVMGDLDSLLPSRK